jgi:hypothetical protein
MAGPDRIRQRHGVRVGRCSGRSRGPGMASSHGVREYRIIVSHPTKPSDISFSQCNGLIGHNLIRPRASVFGKLTSPWVGSASERVSLLDKGDKYALFPVNNFLLV